MISLSTFRGALAAVLFSFLVGIQLTGCADDLPPAPPSGTDAQAELFITEWDGEDSSWVVSLRSDGTGRRFLHAGALAAAPRSGREVWMEKFAGTSQLYYGALDGSDRKVLAVTSDTGSGERLNLFGTALSPTGNRAVYTTSRSVGGTIGTWRFIYSVELNGENKVQLADDAAHDTRVAISPDGLRVAYYQASPDPARWLTNGQLVVRSIYGGPALVLDDSAAPGFDGGSWLEWSPDGLRIAYTGYVNGIPQALIANLSGGDPVNVSEDPHGCYWPVWSPDGSRLAYIGGLDLDVYVVDVNGANRRNLTAAFGEGYSLYPQWSADGKRLVYTAYDGDPEKSPGRIRVLDVQTGSALTVSSSGVVAFWKR